MPTTDLFDLPFPDDDEWLNQGAYAIQQLADALVTRLTPSHVRTNAGADLALTGSYAYVIPGGIASSSTGEWSLSGGALTYNGKARWHLVDFEAEVHADPSGASTSSWQIVLQVGGVEVGRADGEVFGSVSDYTRARITVPVYLTPGVVVTAAALAGSGAGVIGQARIVAASISPKESA